MAKIVRLEEGQKAACRCSAGDVIIEEEAGRFYISTWDGSEAWPAGETATEEEAQEAAQVAIATEEALVAEEEAQFGDAETPDCDNHRVYAGMSMPGAGYDG